MTKVAVDTKKKRKKKGTEETPVHHIGEVSKELLQDLAAKHGTPIFVIDHEKLRENYREFKRHMPDVQVYFAVKANSNPEIVKTLYDIGCSFDVASMPEFMIVYENIRDMPKKERQEWIWDKIIYANTIKPIETLEALDKYKPLVTFDNHYEILKIRDHAPHAGLVLRIRVPNTGSMVELSSQVRGTPGRGSGPDRRGVRQRARCGGLKFPCRQPVHELRELHAGPPDLGQYHQGS